MQLVRQLLLVADRLQRLLDQNYSLCELNGPRVDVLETIARAGVAGCSQTELALAVGAAESSISTLVERMRRDGLLLRMSSRVDRRCSVLVLTEEGEKRITSVAADRDRHLAQWMEQLSNDDQFQLGTLLNRLMQSLVEAPPGSAAEAVPQCRGKAA